MGRLIVVVLVIAAIAFLANKFLLGEGDPPPPGAMKPPVAEAPPAAAAPVASGEQQPAQLDVVAVEADAQPGQPAEKASEQGQREELAEKAARAQRESPPESILLGTPELYDGIDGQGELTVEQVKQWVADPKNHVVLEPQLPLGLAAGAGEIKGLEENPLTRAKIELGRQLFFDPRLSVDNSISCASCHDPDFAYGKDTQFGVGVGGKTGNRNSPVAFNRILSDAQFWDGRAESLEEQAKGPIANPIEMADKHDAVVTDLKGIPAYVVLFEAVFGDGKGDDAVEIENAARAVAAFERTLVTGPAPWDHYQELAAFEQQFGAELEDLEALEEEDPEFYQEYMELKKAADNNPLSESARRGGELFFSDKAGCTQCHLGANFTDEKYHNLGVGMDVEEPDLGRFEVTGEEKDRGAFKTPTVRNIADSAPYMHDGSQKTLEEVVDWYDKGGHPNQWLSDKIKPLKLTDQEKKDLVAFMKEGLQSELPKVERGRFPGQ